MYTLLTQNTFPQFKALLSSSEVVYYDIETWGLDWIQDKIRTAQFRVGGTTYILNVEVSGLGLFQEIIGLIRDSKILVVAHNAKFELKFTFQNTKILLHNVYCSQIAETLLTAGVGKRFPSLSSLIFKYCGVDIEKETRLDFTTSEEITEEMLVYAAKDVLYLEQIREAQLEECKGYKLGKVFDLEMKLLPIVAQMEIDGIAIDWDSWMKIHGANLVKVEELEESLLNTLSERVEDVFPVNALEAFNLLSIPVKTKKKTKFLEELTESFFIKKQVKEEFKFSSHKQKLAALHLMGYPELESTSKDVLNLIPNPNEFILNLLDFSTYAKRVSSFGENWSEYIHPVTGRIHTNYNQVGTATGRWSSDRPNLQNVPRTSEYRNSFVSRPGYYLITADYSQAELRFMGAVSGEKNIVDAYLNDADIHTVTATIVFEKEFDDVTKDERNRSKTLNFSILYVSSAYGISQKNPEFTQNEAEDLLEKFFAGYPQLSTFIKVAGDMIYEQKFSRTPLGRIRFFEDKQFFYTPKEKDKYVRQVKREGINHIIQGGSADSLKLAMVDAYYNNPFGHDKFRFLLQCHDELVVEVAEDIYAEAKDYLIKCMEDAEQQFLGEIPAVVETNKDKVNYWTKD